MSSRTQTIIGVAIILLGLVAVWLQATEHTSIYTFLAVILGSIGGQQIGQAHSRSKRK